MSKDSFRRNPSFAHASAAIAEADALAEQMDELGIDYSNMSAREAEKAYNDAVAAYNENTAAPVMEDGFFADDETAAVPRETFDDVPFQTDESTESAKTREGGPKIASDDETVEAVRIDENAVPEFKKVSELAEWIKNAIGKERTITIISTGQDILVSNAGINRSLKKRGNAHKQVYSEIKKIILER